MKNKLIAVFVAVTLCLCVLCGCVPTQEEPTYEVWSTYNTTKVIQQTYKNDSYTKLDAAINIEMMRGEYEGGQLLVTFDGGKGNVTLKKGILTNSNGDVIPEEAVEIYRQKYIQIQRNYNGGTVYTAGDYIPDMLLPESTAVEYGENVYDAKSENINQGFTVEVCSDNLAAGTYTGNFTLVVDGEETAIPVSVTVWDFQLEGKSTFMSSFLLYREYLASGEYRNDKEITDNYIDFLIKYNVDTYVVRDNYESEHFTESFERYRNNKQMTSIVIPVDFQLNYQATEGNPQFDEAIKYLTELAIASTDEWCYAEHAYFYPSTYDEADWVTDRIEKSEEFFAEDGLYFKTLDAAIEALQENEEYMQKDEALRKRIETAIYNIPAVFTNVNYIADWVANLKDATFCPYMSVFDNYAVLQRYQDQSQGVNGNLWAYSCNETDYPYPTLDIDDVTLGIRVNGWMNKSYGVNGYLYWCTNKYWSNFTDGNNVDTDVYETPSRGDGSNGDGWLLYPGAYYGSDEPFATTRLVAYRDGVDDYNMLSIYEQKLNALAEKYQITVNFDDYVADLYNQLFKGAVSYENSDETLYAVRRELAQRILALDSDDNLLVVKERNGENAVVSVYSTQQNVTVDGNAVSGTAQGDGYVYQITNTGNAATYTINTGVRTVEYSVSAHKVLSVANATLSTGSTYDAENNVFTVKAIEGKYVNLYRPSISVAVQNVTATGLYFTYKNLSEGEIEFRIVLKTTTGNVDVSTNYCPSGASRTVSVLFDSDIDWSTVTAIEITFDNTVQSDGTFVLAADRQISLSDLWLDIGGGGANKMKKFATIIILLLLTCCLVLCACQPPQTDDSNLPDAPQQPLDPTLLNGFENNDDLYSVYPTDISPRDEYKACINTDSAYVKAGNGSFKYTFVNGSSHSFVQLIKHSNLPELDATKLKSVSLQVYNASETTQKLTLSLTTEAGAALFSKQQELQPGVWTEVKYDQLAEFSYKKKTNVAGVLFRFDVESAATLYVDEMRVELGAEDVPPEDFNQVVASIASIAPQSSLTGENFTEYVKFIDLVGYARSLYNDLQDKTGYEASNAQLQTYEALLGGFSAVYTPRSDEDVITKWEYGNGLTVAQEVDENYGAIWSIIVDAKSTGEQSFKFTDLDVSAYGEVVMWMYNPTKFDLKLQIHGGWNSWSAYATTLPSQQWTMVRFNTSIIENDTQNSFFPIISNAQKPFSGTFLFSALYGVPAAESAASVISAIQQLPEAADITLEHKQTVENARTAYEELSKAGKAAVTNYQKLTAAENQIATLEAAAFDQKITQTVSVAITSQNVMERYALVSDLTNEYYALSDLAYYRVTKWADVEAYKSQIELHKKQLVVDMVQAFPNVQDAEFPKLISQVTLAKTLFDELSAEEQSTVDVEKLNALVAQSQKYLLGFDFTVENSDKVSTVTDFGNSWQGTTSYVADSTFGNVMVCDVKQGHTNATHQAEFRLRVYDKIWQYEKICFYVYAPTENASLVVWAENWKNHLDFSLKAGEWTLIEIETSFCSTNNLDGMFCVFTAPSAAKVAGQWKATSVYLYFDQAKTDNIVNAFVLAMESVPEKEQVTLENKLAIVAARQLLDDMPNYCKNYVSQLTKLEKRLTEAEESIEVLESAGKIDNFVDNANALNENSTGEQIINVWLQYKHLGKFQSEISQSIVDAIKNAMKAQPQKVAEAYSDIIANFDSNHDFPRDIQEFGILYDIALNDLPDEVFAELDSNTMNQLKALKKDVEKYKTVATQIRPSKIVTDETYGTVYGYTITSSVTSDCDGCVFKLQANTVTNKTIVFYVYRPQGGGNATFKVALDNPWTEPADLVVSITQDGWTKIEYTASQLDTTRDCYFYLFLSDGTPSQDGWLVSELYVH